MHLAAGGTRPAATLGMTTTKPKPQQPGETTPKEPPTWPNLGLAPHPPAEVAHPIHPPIPVQPIHEGTAPTNPVTTPGDIIQRGGA